MQIGIIGAGNIGGTLGQKWAAAGHTVSYGVRTPEDAKFDGLRVSGSVVSTAEAATTGEVIVLALPGAAVADFAAEHAAALAGKIIIDATNNVGSAEMNSLAVLAKEIPSAQLVRAFSTLGWENFADPQINGEQVDLFYCGAPAARETCEELITDVGLRPVYIGDVEAAAALDGMTRVWFALAFRQNQGRRLAFKLLRSA
jgi:predicted dinucleotide-binding enzyme